MQTQTTKPRMFKVLTPIEKKDGTSWWMRIGTGFPAKDGTSINLHLDVYPADKKAMIHVREMDEEDFRPGRRGGRGEEPAAAKDELPF
jgi:hypothetical protein